MDGVGAVGQGEVPAVAVGVGGGEAVGVGLQGEDGLRLAGGHLLGGHGLVGDAAHRDGRLGGVVDPEDDAGQVGPLGQRARGPLLEAHAARRRDLAERRGEVLRHRLGARPVGVDVEDPHVGLDHVVALGGLGLLDGDGAQGDAVGVPELVKLVGGRGHEVVGEECGSAFRIRLHDPRARRLGGQRVQPVGPRVVLYGELGALERAVAHCHGLAVLGVDLLDLDGRRVVLDRLLHGRAVAAHAGGLAGLDLDLVDGGVLGVALGGLGLLDVVRARGEVAGLRVAGAVGGEPVHLRPARIVGVHAVHGALERVAPVAVGDLGARGGLHELDRALLGLGLGLGVLAGDAVGEDVLARGVVGGRPAREAHEALHGDAAHAARVGAVGAPHRQGALGDRRVGVVPPQVGRDGDVDLAALVVVVAGHGRAGGVPQPRAHLRARRVGRLEGRGAVGDEHLEGRREHQVLGRVGLLGSVVPGHVDLGGERLEGLVARVVRPHDAPAQRVHVAARRDVLHERDRLVGHPQRRVLGGGVGGAGGGGDALDEPAGALARGVLGVGVAPHAADGGLAHVLVGVGAHGHAALLGVGRGRGHRRQGVPHALGVEQDGLRAVGRDERHGAQGGELHALQRVVAVALHGDLGVGVRPAGRLRPGRAGDRGVERARALGVGAQGAGRGDARERDAGVLQAQLARDGVERGGGQRLGLGLGRARRVGGRGGLRCRCGRLGRGLRRGHGLGRGGRAGPGLARRVGRARRVGLGPRAAGGVLLDGHAARGRARARAPGLLRRARGAVGVLLHDREGGASLRRVGVGQRRRDARQRRL